MADNQTPNRRKIVKMILYFIATLWVWLLAIAPVLQLTISETLASTALDISGSVAIFIVVGYVLGKSVENMPFMKKK